MRTILTALLAVLLTTPAFATLVGGTPTTLDQNAAADPWTWTHTTVAGENLLVVACHSTTNTTTFDGITFDSVALSNISTETHATGTSTSTIWRLISPNIGALTVSVNLSGTNDGGCWARSYSGADTTTPVSGTLTQQSSGTAPSLSVTCPAGNEAVDIGGTASLRTVTIAQTTLVNSDDGAGQVFGSYAAGAGTTVMSESWASATAFTHIATCVVAAGSTGRGSPIIFQ